MSEYSRSAQGSFVSTGAAKVVNLPFQPTALKMINYTAATTPAQHGVPFAWWESGMGQGYAVEQVFNVTPVLTTDIVTVNGFSTFSAGQLLQYGAVYTYTNAGNPTFAISKASPAVVTTSVAHGLSSGDVVIFENLYQSSSTGMIQICGIPFTITYVSSTSFSIPWNTNQTGYTAFDSSTATGHVGSYKKVLYPYLYLPGVNVVTAVTTGPTTSVTTTTNHNYVVGQEIAFRIPPVWGITQLGSLPNVLIPGSPVYGFVTSVTSNTAFVCNINSTGYTAFTSNIPFATALAGGLTFPQVVAVGDVNSGGFPYSGGALYPSPSFPTYSGGSPTINGPAIQGAFVNSTSQGFVVGAGAGTADTSSVLVGANADVIYWEAYYFDINS